MGLSSGLWPRPLRARLLRTIGTRYGAAALGRHMAIVDPLSVRGFVGEALFERLCLLGSRRQHGRNQGEAQRQYFPHWSQRLAKGQIDAAIPGQRVFAFGKRGDAVIDEAIGTTPNDNIAALQQNAPGAVTAAIASEQEDRR